MHDYTMVPIDSGGFNCDFEKEELLGRGPLKSLASLDISYTHQIFGPQSEPADLRDRVVRTLGGERGEWFYAVWHDQAVVDFGEFRDGGVELLDRMLDEFDNFRPDQNGDMMVGVLLGGRKRMLTIEASPENYRYEVWHRVVL